MKKRIVLHYDGSADAGARIRDLAAAHGADVVTVSLDLGTTELDAMRQRALAAGAIRAHALDVREEFARDYVLPALRSGSPLEGDAIARLADPLVDAKLAEIALIEHAEVASSIAAPTGGATNVAKSRAVTQSEDGAAHVAIEFVNGVPASINGVSMRIVELLESLTTIAAGQGIDGHELYGPAIGVLKVAYAAGNAAVPSGTVRLKLTGGTCAVVDRMALTRA